MDAKGLLVLLMIAGVVVAVIMIRRPRRRSGPSAFDLGRPFMERFFRHTGYAFVDSPGAPLLAQLDRWVRAEQDFMRPGGAYNVQLVRNYQGLQVYFQRTTEIEGRTIVYSQVWTTAPGPLSAPFHVVHRSLLQGPERQALSPAWQPAFPTAVLTGDPEFDQRFVVFSAAPEQRIRSIFQNPRLRGALLACVYVDLRVLPDRVSFSDPREKNTVAVRGNIEVVESLRPGRPYEIGIPVHDRVADILLGATSLAR